ncbi:hypothetical protein E3N88_14127 [Mikania micrantha]|uniref:Uncharacterized protein n=1 Tax=Mikania micrantha TaxID=192012 RepID=A0A5N6P1W3_9ASTR|nr:hypothetical protein E3N88_14127 [Mikania micrantha]
MSSSKKKSPISVKEEEPEDKTNISRISNFAPTYVDKISNNDLTSFIKVKKVDFPFDYGPFDDEWVLNYKFDDYIVQDTLPCKEESPNERIIHFQKPTDYFPKREEDVMSTGSVESLNTLISWANHNPYEDEQSTDFDNLTD